MVRRAMPWSAAFLALLGLGAGVAFAQSQSKSPTTNEATRPSPGRAADVSPKPARGPTARPMPEAMEMLLAIARGSEMGPGDGWFHPSASRYGWEWLKTRYDADGDGKISRKELQGPAELFDRLDRDRDGTLSASDFDWTDRTSYAMQGMPAANWFRMADANSNGRIGRDEWSALFAKASKGKDYLTPDDLREAFPVAPPPRPANAPKASAGPSPSTLALGLLSGELGSVFEGPKIGDKAPEFSLRTVDGKRQISLSDYVGKKPLVMIFGSFT